MSGAVYRLDIPLKPRGKGRPLASSRHGFARIYTDKKTRDHEAEISEFAKEFMKGRKMLSGVPLKLLVISIYEPPAGWSAKLKAAALSGMVPYIIKPDWDNLGKVTDALNGIVWSDDSLVIDGRSLKRYGQPARIYVEISDASFEGMVLPPVKAPAAKDPAKPKKSNAKGWGGKDMPLLDLAIGRRIR